MKPFHGLVFLIFWAGIKAASSSDIITNIDKLVTAAMGCGSSQALSLAVVQNGKTILSKGYGTAGSSSGQPTSSKTKFAIGSLTNAFTALLAAKMTSGKTAKAKLDTPISTFLPDFQVTSDTYRSAKATLRDLLSHRMAVPSPTAPYIMGLDPLITRGGFASRNLNLLESPFSFREKFVYNDYMHSVAAYVLEKLDPGRSWEELIEDNILTPLGMSDSGFIDRLHNYSDFAAPSYADAKGNLVDLDPKLFHTAHIGEGSIYSTADDMAKWMNLMLNQKVVTGIAESTVKQIFKGGIAYTRTEVPNSVYHKKKNYRLGWYSEIYREHDLFTHDGGTVTHKSMIWLFPGSNVGIFITANAPHYDVDKEDLLKSVLYYTSDLLLGLQPWYQLSDVCRSRPWRSSQVSVPPPQKTITIPRQQLAAFTGEYYHAVFGNAIVKVSSGHLYFKFGRYGTLYLYPVSKTSFRGHFSGFLSYLNRDQQYETWVDFELDANQVVSSLTLRMWRDEGKTVGPFKKRKRC